MDTANLCGVEYFPTVLGAQTVVLGQHVLDPSLNILFRS